ncbi:hypothetical protein AT6N2_C2285 [Agrobacterium tumefaciens]|nr:hypothetical protein AT6N2_C2285 [Agrobacterium tumefaciens]
MVPQYEASNLALKTTPRLVRGVSVLLGEVKHLGIEATERSQLHTPAEGHKRQSQITSMHRASRKLPARLASVTSRSHS